MNLRPILASVLISAASLAPQIAFARPLGANSASIEQTGEQNLALVRQRGRGNGLSLIQTGAANTACLVQVGRNLDLDITQTGDGQAIALMQTRGNVHALPSQACRAITRAR